MNSEVAKCVRTDGALYNLGWYLSWHPGEAEACLDGQFTADDLRSIADHMDEINAQDTRRLVNRSR